MNNLELVEEIKNISKLDLVLREHLADTDNEGFPVISKQKKYEYLRKEFSNSNFFRNDYKWHEVVSLALDEDQRMYMYEEILNLIEDYDSHSKELYFQLLSNKNEQLEIPPLRDITKLLQLTERYWKIYYNIKNQINFDQVKKRNVGIIKGKINWSETIRRSNSKFPIEFVNSHTERKYVTPENILLIICANWLHKESNRLLQINYDIELDERERKFLTDVYKKADEKITNFPFKEVIRESRVFWELNANHSKITQLENKTKKRIREKTIRNNNYEELLEWIKDFRELNIQLISGQSSTKNSLQALRNVDTMYEVWIFLKFIDYLKRKKKLISFQFGRHPRCKFTTDEKNTVTFWYEKWFNVGDKKSNSWAVPHHPDFTAMLDDKVIAVFDAKNYSKSTSVSDAQNKILSYMNNLNTNCGVLIFPEHPKIWDEIEKKDERGNLLGNELKDLPSGYTRNAKNLSWNELKSSLKERFGMDIKEHYLGLGFKKEEYPKNRSVSIEEKKIFALCRMQPGNNNQDKNAKERTEQSLDFIFKSIESKIPILA